MRQALSIRKDDTFLDPRALPRSESLISTCCGLVVVEDESQIVRLVHYTTEEYFRRKLQYYGSPEAHRYFAGTLITYLNFAAFTTFSQDKMMEDLVNKFAKNDRFSATRSDSCDDETAVNDYMKKLFEDKILVQYAAENWGHHVRDAFANLEHNPESCIATTGSQNTEMNNSWNLEHLVLDLMGKKPNIACANEVSHYIETKLDLWNYQVCSPSEATDLHIAASFGMKFFVDCFLNQGADIGARDSEGMTALHKAEKNGHEEVVRLLLDSGLRCDSRS